MKKSLLALVLAALVLLAACSGGGTSTAAAPAASLGGDSAAPANTGTPSWIGGTLQYDLNAPVNGGADIDILMWAEPETEPYYQAISDKYMAVHPNVKVQVVSQPWDDYWTKLPLALESGNGPDLYRSHYGHIGNLAKYSYNLPEDIFPRAELYADFPAAEDLVMADGNLYSIPLGSTFSSGIYYNKTMWAGAGLGEDDIPKTWDEFIEIGVKLTQKDAAGNVTQYGFSIDSSFQNFIVAMNYGSGLALLKEDQFTWNLDTPEMYENLDLLRAFKDEHGFMMYSDGDCEDQFGHGQCAMMSNWNWVGGYFNDVYPDVDWGYFLMPTKDGNPAPAYGLKDYEWALGVSAADEAKRAVAFDLYKYFLCEQETFADVAIRLGLMPANVHLTSDPRVQEYENLVVADTVADRFVYLGAIPSNDVRNKALQVAGADIFVNGRDPREVIPATQASIMQDITQNAMDYTAVEEQYAHYDELHI